MSSREPARARAVRVLVAAAADPPGRLAGLLEAGGHRVVARAATAEELARLVQVTRPEVVVFDAEMSAQTVAALRISQPGVGVVVVWPQGAAAGSVHEQVSPARVRHDLAGAVRRAAPLGAAATVLTSLPMAADAFPADDAARTGRGGLELAVAAVLTFLLVLSAVGFRITQGGEATVAGAAVPSAPPSASATGTSTPLVPPGPAPVGASDPATMEASPRVSSRAPSDGGSGIPLAGEAPPAERRAPDPAPLPPVLDGPVTARQAGDGPMIFAREQACRASAARLGIVGAGPPLRRLLDRCVATDSAGLLRALARLVGPGATPPGRGSGNSPAHRGGRGDRPDRGSAANHRKNGLHDHRASSGRASSSADGRRSGHRPGANGSTHGHGHGNGVGQGRAGSRGPRH